MSGDLAAVTHEVREGLRGLADVTASSRVNFEGGDYNRIYIKPNFKLGSSLLTSREVLMLVTAFREVQARTIKMAEACLSQTKGRLEPGMAIIVHYDPYGDDRLRVWGRERGITILPVNATGGIPHGDAFEQMLCAALYSHDPFDLTGPVRSAHQFFGRTDVPDIARRLREGHIQAIFGVRKSGKTSVLNRVLDECRAYHGIACAMADCSDDELWGLDAGRLMNSIAGAVSDAVRYTEDHYATVIALPGDAQPAEAARTLLNTLTSASQPVLLLVDEIDYITPSSSTTPHWRTQFNPFFRALRQVYQECCRRNVAFSVLLTGVSSYWFTAEDVDGVENSALALVPETYLPPLERAQSIGMIQALGRSAGLIFSHGASDTIAKTCGDFPFWIRKAGSFINSCFSYGDRPTKLRHPDVFRLTEEFVSVEGGPLAFSSLRHLFRIYPDLGDVALGALNSARVESYPHPLVSALGRYGILGEGFDPSGPMIEAGLRLWEADVGGSPRQLPLRTAPVATISSKAHRAGSERGAEVAAGSASPAAEEEWADLLSEVSRSRNLLERELRDFVLTVLRVECAQRDDGRKPLDLMVAAVPNERRHELNTKSASAVAKGLYWLELIAVMKKNWTLFDRYFGDRRQLELYGDIVNDRPDAHAKEFDGAELALQRRAIDWFRKSIEAAGVL